MKSKNINMTLLVLAVIAAGSALVVVQVVYVAPYIKDNWINPQRIANHNRNGIEAYERGDWDSAISEFTESIRLKPKDIFAITWRAHAWYMKKNWDKAISDYDEVIRLTPFEGGIYVNRANCRAQKGEMELALKDYDEGIKQDPTEAPFYHSRGATYMHTGDWQKAIADFDKAIQLGLKDPRLYMGRAASYEGLGDMERALDDYQTGFRMSPKDFQVQNNLAWFLATCPQASLRNGKEAVRLATEACERSNWNEANCIDTLAAAEAEAGDFAQAVKHQKQAMAINSESEESRKRMGERLALYEANQPHHEPPKRKSVPSRKP